MVINAVTKNHIHGYVSAPKYRGADLEALANSGANNADTTAGAAPANPDGKPSPLRQRLPVTSTPSR